jgi:lysophospholipase L1-like esterase
VSVRRLARFLALGDSYTIGETVLPEDGWVGQLIEALRLHGVFSHETRILARTGWTTDELSAAMDKAGLEGPFDLVTLLIGVNNQYRGRSAEEYRAEFRGLLDRAVGLAGSPTRVIVLSIPDWGVTPFAASWDRSRIAHEIDEFNALKQAETSSAGARYVDVTPVSRRAATDEALTASDGLHPSRAMYAEWVRLVLPVALEALGESQAVNVSRGNDVSA